MGPGLTVACMTWGPGEADNGEALLICSISSASRDREMAQSVRCDRCGVYRVDAPKCSAWVARPYILIDKEVPECSSTLS